MGGGIIYFHDLFRGTYCIEAGLSKIGIFFIEKKRNNIVSTKYTSAMFSSWGN